MELKHYKAVFIGIALIGIVLLAMPSIALIVKLPPGQQFSYIYLLGPDHMFDSIPSNVQAGVIYSVYLGVGNQMGSSEYYTCAVKIGNESAVLPNSTLGEPSPLPVLFDYKFLLSANTVWEAPLTFEINQLATNGSGSYISALTINGVEYSTSLHSAWDSNRSGYYYTLLIELYMFNSGVLTYDNRYVAINLNVS